MTIQSGIFGEETMCTPNELLHKIPKLPEDGWTSIDFFQSEDGVVQLRPSYKPLPSVNCLWHENLVDYLGLKPIRKLSARVREVSYLNQRAIAKIARFPWEINQVSKETLAYCMIFDKQEEEGLEAIAPKFLGHLHENGRVMGMLLQKLEGRHAEPEDLAACTEVVRKLHAMGIEHGDVNKHNFMIGKATRKACILDLEHATNAKGQSTQRECASIADELAEDTGRGAYRTPID